jgi:hypothetical protein
VYRIFVLRNAVPIQSILPAVNMIQYNINKYCENITSGEHETGYHYALQVLMLHRTGKVVMDKLLLCVCLRTWMQRI